MLSHPPLQDWRECSKCVPKPGSSQLSDGLWRGLNPYNFYPLLSKDVPRHSLCDRCDKCQRKYISGVEGSSHGRGMTTCLRCSGVAGW